MKTILITNRKGGVGKTTTTVNLASWLGLLGKRILIIDLDTQSHAQYGFGLNIPFKKGIHNALEKKRKLNTFIEDTPYENVSIIPANINFNTNLISNDDVYLLDKLIKKSRFDNQFDICIIDTPPTSSILLLNALAVSNFAIVPMKTEFLGVVALKQFLKMFYETASKVNENIEFLGVLPTMYNKSMKEHLQIIEQVSDYIGKDKILQAIRNDLKLSVAFLEGKPISYLDKRCRGSSDYKALSELIVKKIDL